MFCNHVIFLKGYFQKCFILDYNYIVLITIHIHHAIKDRIQITYGENDTRSLLGTAN